MCLAISLSLYRVHEVEIYGLRLLALLTRLSFYMNGVFWCGVSVLSTICKIVSPRIHNFGTILLARIERLQFQRKKKGINWSTVSGSSLHMGPPLFSLLMNAYGTPLNIMYSSPSKF